MCMNMHMCMSACSWTCACSMSPVGRVTTDRGAGAEQRRCAAGEGDGKGLGYGAWQAPHLGQLGAVVRRRLGSILHLAVLVADDREAILVLLGHLLLLPRCLFVLVLVLFFILVLLFLLVAVLLATVLLLAVLLLLLLLLLPLLLLLRLRGGNVSESERVVVAVPANPRNILCRWEMPPLRHPPRCHPRDPPPLPRRQRSPPLLQNRFPVAEIHALSTLLSLLRGPSWAQRDLSSAKKSPVARERLHETPSGGASRHSHRRR